MQDWFFLAVGILLAGIGTLLLWAGIRQRVRCSHRLTITVASVKTEQTMIRGSTLHLYRPRFSYEVDGKTYRAEAPFRTPRENKYREGDEMSAFCDPRDPESLRFPGRIAPFPAALGFLAVGVTLIVCYFL